MFSEKKQETAMNLPVGTHIDRLADMIALMKHESESLQKDLQILRGSITQLSYVNKEADQ